MRSTLIVVPSLKGHFRDYISYLKASLEGECVQVAEIPTSTFRQKVRSCLLFLKASKSGSVIFLHGEPFLLPALLLKVVFPRTRFKLLFYYLLNRRNSFGMLALKAILLLTARVLRIDCVHLEEPSDLARLVRVVKDPVSCGLENQSKAFAPSNDRPYRILVAGYLDERKGISLLLTSIANIVQKDPDCRIELSFLGDMVPSVRSAVERSLRNLSVEGTSCEYGVRIRANYSEFTVEEYSNELELADLVYAVYQNHYGSSGLVINAIARGKRVLFVPLGALGRFAAELRIRNLPCASSLIEVQRWIERELRNWRAMKSEVQYEECFALEFLKGRDRETFARIVLNASVNA